MPKPLRSRSRALSALAQSFQNTPSSAAKQRNAALLPHLHLLGRRRPPRSLLRVKQLLRGRTKIRIHAPHHPFFGPDAESLFKVVVGTMARGPKHQQEAVCSRGAGAKGPGPWPGGQGPGARARDPGPGLGAPKHQQEAVFRPAGPPDRRPGARGSGPKQSWTHPIDATWGGRRRVVSWGAP